MHHVYSSPEGHLDRRGESGQDHEKKGPWSTDLAELKAEVRTEMACQNTTCVLRFIIYTVCVCMAVDRERFGAVNSPLSIFITLFIYLNEHLF